MFWKLTLVPADTLGSKSLGFGFPLSCLRIELLLCTGNSICKMEDVGETEKE